jgi:uridine kinase
MAADLLRAADRDAVIAAVRRIAATRAGQTRWIGIDGCGGAGKSTLAEQVAAAVPAVAVVHIDDFAGPRIPEWDWARFDAQVVRPLTAGRPARYQRWDWDTDAGAEWHDIAPGAVVVVEGVSSTRREVRAPWALTVWVEASRQTRLRRARERDGEALLPRWLQDWMPSEDAYVAREHPQDRVDLVVSGE